MTVGLLNTHVKMRVREAERFAVSVMSQLRLGTGAAIDVMICNLSTRGFMINSPGYIPVDTSAHLVVPGVGACEAMVVWSFCGDTGGVFKTPIDLDLYWAATGRAAAAAGAPDAPPMSPSQHLGQWFERGAERINADGAFSLDTGSGFVVDARICDISTLGLKGTCAAILPIGTIVGVDIPGVGPVEAEVKWQLADQFGGMFLDPIDLKKCEWSAVKARFG